MFDIFQHLATPVCVDIHNDVHYTHSIQVLLSNLFHMLTYAPPALRVHICMHAYAMTSTMRDRLQSRQQMRVTQRVVIMCQEM